MTQNRTGRIVSSALWAAYGDALGFITELTDKKGVLRRAKIDFVSETLPWRRLVGGKFGTTVNLPAGCYSDDTQLRLSTSRAIRGDGTFDVDAFTKVELPVFDAYSLGAGNSTKAAAHSLASSTVAWFANFYKSGTANYLEAGGNGALMRIQPHVWCDPLGELSARTIREIIRNVITTHGHPRALAGALLHAFQLAFAIRNQELQGPEEWKNVITRLKSVSSLLRKDEQINAIWLPSWEQAAGKNWDLVWDEALTELVDLLGIAASVAAESQTLGDGYRRLVERLNATSERVRGDAIRTAILAQYLAWIGRFGSPNEILITAANMLDTDTDTIASAAGALLGSTSDEYPSGELLDRAYIAQEAVRLSEIAAGQKRESFRYPNILTWQPPKSQLDAVCTKDGKLQIPGLGAVKSEGRVFAGRKPGEDWQILTLDFGQTVIIKRRHKVLPCRSLPQSTPIQAEPAKYSHLDSASSQQLSLLDPVYPTVNSTPVKQDPLDLITSRLISEGFEASQVGNALLRYAELEDGLERGIAFAAIIIKAKRARLNRNNPK